MPRAFPMREVIVLPGDSYHIAASAPDLCAQHALRFIDAVAEARRPARNLTACWKLSMRISRSLFPQ